MASHGLPEAAKPADNCGSYWAPREHVADGLGLGGGAAAGKRAKSPRRSCHLLAVLSLLCIVWITVFPVEIAARRRVRLPSGVSFFCGKFYVSLVDQALYWQRPATGLLEVIAQCLLYTPFND